MRCTDVPLTSTCTSATHSLQVVRICVYAYICVYECICIWIRLCVYHRISFDASRCCCWDVLSVYKCACAYICICVCMYACICACAYVCICIYVCLCICMHVHVYAHAYGCTYALVKAHFVYLYCPIPLLHAYVSQRFCQHQRACVVGDWKWDFILNLVHSLRLLLAWESMFWQGYRYGLCLVYFSIFAGVRVVGGRVLVHARTRTQTTCVLDVSPGVRQTPGGPEESRSTQAQYTCRPYRCTFVYIYAGLRVLMIWANCLFFFLG